MPQRRFSCNCISSLLWFLDFDFFICICKSPLAVRLKTTQRCILQNQVFLVAKLILQKMARGWKGHRFHELKLLLFVVVLDVCDRCLFPYKDFLLPLRRFSCTCVLSLLRFPDSRFFIFLCNSPRAARLKKRNVCFLQNRMLFWQNWFCKMACGWRSRRVYEFIWFWCCPWFEFVCSISVSV